MDGRGGGHEAREGEVGDGREDTHAQVLGGGGGEGGGGGGVCPEGRDIATLTEGEQ